MVDTRVTSLLINDQSMNTTQWLALLMCFDVENCKRNENGIFYGNFEDENLNVDPSGKHFRIVTLQNLPFSAMEFNNGNISGKGLAFHVINILKEKLNFTYEVHQPDRNVMGDETHGIFGTLMSGKSDFAAAFLPIMPKFSEYVHFSVGLYNGEWVVMMKRPSASATGSGALAPFTKEVWMLAILSLLATGPVIYGFIRLKMKLSNGDCVIEQYTLPTCVWFVYGAMMRQASTLSPVTDSTRMLFGTWLFFITILTAFYTANLTAFLTLSKFTLPIENAADIGRNKYYWITREGNYIQMKMMDGGIFANDLKGSTGFYVHEDHDVILNSWVKSGKYIYIEEKPVVEDLMYHSYLKKMENEDENSQKCIYVMSKPIIERIQAFAYRKDFPYGRLFDITLLQIVESGILQHLIRDDLPNTQICPLNLESPERQLANENLRLSYYIVLVGYLISLAVFLSELAITSTKKRRKVLEQRISLHMKSEISTEDSDEEVRYVEVITGDVINRRIVNGIEYVVVDVGGGNTKLMPIKSASALLYRYSHKKTS